MFIYIHNRKWPTSRGTGSDDEHVHVRVSQVRPGTVSKYLCSQSIVAPDVQPALCRLLWNGPRLASQGGGSSCKGARVRLTAPRYSAQIHRDLGRDHTDSGTVESRKS